MKRYFLILALLTVSAANGQVFPYFPIVGKGAYSCGQVNSISDCTVPAGPPALTGNETLLLDTNLPNGDQPSTVLSTVDTLKAYINICPIATTIISGCVRPDGTTITVTNGIITAIVGGTGTVTSITAGTGLNGGTITSTGTISLANTAVSAGPYTNANITVDAQGRITSASNGSAGAGTVTSVATGSGLSGGTITSTGTIVCVTSTASVFGCAKPDGVTISASGGVYSAIGTNAITLTNHFGSTVIAGSAIYISAANQFDPARANAYSTSGVIALTNADILTTVSGAVTAFGELTLTTGQWDMVTGGSGGLAFGSLYFLDPSTAGRLTTTAPSTVGQVVTLIGRAISSTIMLVNIQPPIQL